MADAASRSVAKSEPGIVAAMKTSYFMAKNDIAVSKFSDMVDFLKDQECPDIAKLAVAKNATYQSETSAVKFVDSIAQFTRQTTDEKISASPVISLMIDETTDISIEKKLLVSARILDPETFIPSTHFITDVSFPWNWAIHF